MSSERVPRLAFDGVGGPLASPRVPATGDSLCTVSDNGCSFGSFRTIGRWWIPDAWLGSILRRFGLTEMAMFGSVVRGEQTYVSDVDLLSVAGPDARLGFAINRLEDELAALFGRPVDVVRVHGATIGGMLEAHRDVIDRLRVSIDGLAERLPSTPKRGSDRYQERSALRATSGGGGQARAKLHDNLEQHTRLILAHVSTLLAGVSATFAVADEYEGFNASACAVLTRSTLESAGALAWLYEPGVDPATRTARFASWTLRDMREFKKAFGKNDPLAASILAQASRNEAQIGERIAAAKWTIKGTKVAEVGSSGKWVDRPSIGDLVAGLFGAETAAYAILSGIAHGNVVAIAQGVQSTGQTTAAGDDVVFIRSAVVPPALVVQLIAIASSASIREFAIWSGVDTAQLDHALRAMFAIGAVVTAPTLEPSDRAEAVAMRSRQRRAR